MHGRLETETVTVNVYLDDNRTLSLLSFSQGPRELMRTLIMNWNVERCSTHSRLFLVFQTRRDPKLEFRLGILNGHVSKEGFMK